MSSSPFNNGEEDTRVVREDLRRDEAREAAMEEEEGNPFGVHSLASERGTLAGISTHPKTHQAMGFSHNQVNQEVQGELPPRRPLHRLHRNNFRNLIHNYGFENTPRRHIPSNWDISCPRENSAGTKPWGLENKHIMAEVNKKSELLNQALREIQGLKYLLMVILENATPPPPPSSSSP